MLASHYQGDELLERGVLAELKGSPQPGLFKEALRLFEQTATEMARLEKAYGELLALHQQAALDPAFETAVARILKDAGPFERPGLEGSRYSMVARGTPERPPSGSGFRTLIEIVAAQQADLGLVRRQMEETIKAFRDVIPLAEKGQFAPLILSGRWAFADKILQSINLIQVYSRFFTRSCLVTIDATMQIYPAGLAWLKELPAEPPPARGGSGP